MINAKDVPPKLDPYTHFICWDPQDSQPIHDDDHKDDNNNNNYNVYLKLVKVFSPTPIAQVNPGNKKGLGVASLNLTNIQVAFEFDPILNITRIVWNIVLIGLTFSLPLITFV